MVRLCLFFFAIMAMACAARFADQGSKPFANRGSATPMTEADKERARLADEAVARSRKEEAEAQQALIEVVEARKAQSPLAGFDLQLFNGYSESIFAVYIDLPDTGETSLFKFEAVRIRPRGNHNYTISGRPGQRVNVRIAAMSLGTVHRLSVTQVFPGPGSVMQLVYMWDVATAKFVLGVKWGSELMPSFVE